MYDLYFVWFMCSHIGHIFSLPITVDILSVENVYPNSAGSSPYTSPGFETAIEDLNRIYASKIDFHHVRFFSYNYVNCTDVAIHTDEMLSQWYYNGTRQSRNMTVFIFAGCGDFVFVNRMAAEWNLLMITSGGSSRILRDKVLSPTWITGASLTADPVLKLYMNLLQMYGWKTPYILADFAASPFYLDVDRALRDTLPSINNYQVISRYINSADNEFNDTFAPVLKEFEKSSRVLIFLGHGLPLRNLLLHAAKLGMTNGEYVYIAAEMFENPLFGRFNWNYNDSNDAVAKEAYRSLIIVGTDHSIYDVPSDALVKEWKKRSLITYNFTYDVNPFVMSSYSSTIMFGKVLDETVSTGGWFDLSNGKAFAQRFLNRTFKLNYTEMYIDSCGERRTDLIIRDLDVISGEFLPTWFQDKETSTLRVVRDIDWGSPVNVVPSNEPFCGYLHDHPACKSTNSMSSTYVSAIIPVCLAFIIGIMSAIVKMRKPNIFTVSDYAMWWKMDPDEFYFFSETYSAYKSPLRDWIFLGCTPR